MYDKSLTSSSPTLEILLKEPAIANANPLSRYFPIFNSESVGIMFQWSFALKYSVKMPPFVVAGNLPSSVFSIGKKSTAFTPTSIDQGLFLSCALDTPTPTIKSIATKKMFRCFIF